MSRASSIPPNLEPEVLARAGEGLSLQRIAAWLLSEHSVKTSAHGVMRVLKRIKEERAPIAKAVVQEKLAGTLTTDLDAVSGLLARARSIEESATAGDEMDLELALRAQDRQLKALTLRLELSGAGAGGKDDFEDLVVEAKRIRDARRSK